MGWLGVVVGPGLLSHVLPHLPRVVCAAASGAGTHEQLSGALWLRLAAVSESPGGLCPQHAVPDALSPGPVPSPPPPEKESPQEVAEEVWPEPEPQEEEEELEKQGEEELEKQGEEGEGGRGAK